MPKKLQIYFVAVILILETWQEKSELSIVLFADQIKAGT